MSITNLIDYDNITIVQGVNGIRLCEETWMKERDIHVDVSQYVNIVGEETSSTCLLYTSPSPRD